MSLRDKKQIMSTDQAITATADSTNVINLGSGTDSAGTAIILDYNQMTNPYNYLNVRLGVTDWTTCTSCRFALYDSADNSSFATTTADSGVILVAALLAGTVILSVPIPKDCRQYVKMVYTVAGSNAAAATVDAWIGLPYNA